tara:strand:- start:521391 stop:521561 length:171 start_codon:yes stop_codon:yes gene_type:complete
LLGVITGQVRINKVADVCIQYLETFAFCRIFMVFVQELECRKAFVSVVPILQGTED